MLGGLVLVVPLFLLLAGGVVVMVVLALTHRPDAALSAEVASARRHGVVTSGVATAMLVLGPVLVWVATSTLLPLGPLLGVLPLSGAAMALLVLMAGELTWLLALAVVVGLALLVVRAATDRAAVVAADAATDRLLRRSSAARAFRVALVGTLLTLAADLFFGGMAAHNVLAGPARVAAVTTLVVGLGCGLAGLAALLWPVPRLRAVAAAPPTPAHA